jgi:hypothetical protein
MDTDLAKIDDAVLALLYLTRHDGMRAWKGVDWDALGRLHAKGLIHDPVNKAKSVVFTEAGLLEAQRVFARDFTKPAPVLKTVRYGQSTAIVQDASGVNGVLCRDAENGRYFFRVYGEDGAFQDFDVRHDDLPVTIAADALASFYSVGEERVLDHSPDVLGLNSPRGNHSPGA